MEFSLLCDDAIEKLRTLPNNSINTCVYCCKRCPYVLHIGTGFGCELWTKEEKCTIR